MTSPSTYLCACGRVSSVPTATTLQRRRWGTTRYAPAFTHRCPVCTRTNDVHDGQVVVSIPHRRTPRKEDTP